jgi:hypothetical protein
VFSLYYFTVIYFVYKEKKQQKKHKQVGYIEFDMQNSSLKFFFYFHNQIYNFLSQLFIFFFNSFELLQMDDNSNSY